MGGEGSGDLPGHEFHGNQWTEGSGGVSPQILDHINQFKKINALNRQDKERLYAYKKGKSVAVSISGTYNTVTLPSGSLKDCDIVHNHPSDNPSFSPEDIYLSSSANVNSVSAVSISNGTWVILRPEAGWGDATDHIKVERAFKKAISDERSSPTTKELIAKIQVNDITQEQGELIFRKNLARRALKSIGLTVEELP